MFKCKYILLLLFIFSVNYHGIGQDYTDNEISEHLKIVNDSADNSAKITSLIKIIDYYNKSYDFEQGNLYNDQLLTLINVNHDAEVYISALTRKCYFLRKTGNFKEGLIVAKQAIKVSKKYNNYNLDNAYWQEANLFSSLHEFDSVEISCQKLINSTNNKLLIIDANSLLGMTYLVENLYEKSIKKFLEVRDLAKEVDDPYGETNALYNIGQIFIDIGQEEQALEYFQNAIEISKKNNLEGGVAYCNYMMGTIYEKEKKYGKSLEYFDLAIPVQEKLGLHLNLLQTYNSQAEVYVKMNMYDSVTSKYNKVMELEKRIGSTHMRPLVYLNYAKIKYNEDDYEAAYKYLDSINDINEIPIEVKIDYFELMSKLTLSKKEYSKAYDNLYQFMVLKDSLNFIQNKKEAYILESNYQFEKKEQEIATLNTNNRVKNLQLYLSLGFGVIVLLLLFILYNRFKVNKKSKKDLEELDKIKSRFFANISHEFRTPLTLIMGIIQKRLNDSGENNEYDLHMALRNSQRLKTLIDQLLDLSKIEFNKMPLSVEKVNLHNFLKSLHAFFITKAQERNIAYTLEINNVCDEGFIDIDKVEKIVINLLSNAFKFTPKGEKIHVKAVINTQELYLSVKDTGIGLSEQAGKKVFDRFYQADESSTRNSEGSGIGLALSKELAEIHKGKLTLASVKDGGSEFVLSIPINKKAFKIQEVSAKNKPVKYKNISSEEPITGVLQDNNDNKPWILVVEDNADMQKFIYSILKDEYSVILASHGEEAFKLSTEKVPNVIISDYMMPGMDGIEFCKKIKENMITSHIPVIMLTAKAGQDNKIEGLENGADIYLTKPFDQKELMLHIRNLITQFQRLDELFKNQKGLVTILPNFPSKEKTFLNKIHTVLEEKFHLEDYGIDQLADDLFLSRMQVYRKIKALTGKSPGDVLRNFRIERAKQLLEISSLTISEVAIKTGYKNQSNFSKIFKECTGVTPSQYVKNQKRPFIN